MGEREPGQTISLLFKVLDIIFPILSLLNRHYYMQNHHCKCSMILMVVSNKILTARDGLL